MFDVNFRKSNFSCMVVVGSNWTNYMIQKMLEGQRTFVIGNDSVKRCNIHSEKKFFLAREIKVAKKFKVLAVLDL